MPTTSCRLLHIVTCTKTTSKWDHILLLSQYYCSQHARTPGHRHASVDTARIILPRLHEHVVTSVVERVSIRPPGLKRPKSPDAKTYTDHSIQQSTTSTTSPLLWEQSSFTDVSPPSPELCDSSYSTLPSPSDPKAIEYPDLYALPKEEFDQDIKPEQIFDFGSFDHWIGWDEPAENALSPTTTNFCPELKMEPTTPNMKYQNCSLTNGREESGGVFVDDQINQPLFQTADQPHENLYSTPLSWSPPAVTSNIRNSEPYGLAPALSPRQQSRLIAQAMPSRSRACPSSPSSASSPEPERCNGRKRKSTSYASEDEDEDNHSPQPTSNGRHPPVKKTAHNMIEKRYRTNLNDKIAALRESVPSLRVITKRNSKGEEVVEDLQGLTPAHKLNKVSSTPAAGSYFCCQ